MTLNLKVVNLIGTHFFNARFRKFNSTAIFQSKQDISKFLKSLSDKYDNNQIEAELGKGEEHFSVQSIAPDCPIKEVFVQQLAANSKLEDRWNVGLNQVSGEVSSFLAGIVDGHSGHDCAHVVNKGALEYIAASYLDHEKLMHCLQDYKDIPHYTIVRNFLPGHWEPLNESTRTHLKNSLFMYMHELLDEENRIVDGSESMKRALRRLDTDMCIPRSEDQLETWLKSRPLLRLSLSGAVGLFLRCYWKEPHQNNPSVHVGNVGDSEGIIVRQDKKTGEYIGVKLAEPHVYDNEVERERIRQDHPNDDPELMFKDKRLCGELMCFRAFGDVRYKWPREWLATLGRKINISDSVSPVPNPYTSPPYLTAEPEVYRYDLNLETDKYIVLGTDGLWDVMSPDDVATVVTMNPGSEENELATSPATNLLKVALCRYSGLQGNLTSEEAASICYEESQTKQHSLSMHLALPKGVARHFRDDITVVVLKL